MNNLFFFNRKKAITFFLIAFMVYVTYFSSSVSAFSVIVNTPSGIVNWAPGAHVVDWNVLGAGAQTDFNTSVNAYIYSGITAGSKTTLHSSIIPLFSTINPDANSQGWIGTSILQAQIKYDTTNKKDGAGSIQIDRHAGDLYYPNITKWIPDLNLSDINRNNGQLSFWVRSTVNWNSQGSSVYLVNGAGDPIAWWGNCYCTGYNYPDTNNTWQKITLDLNTSTNQSCQCAATQTSFDKNIVKGINIYANVAGSSFPDNNVWIDGIRIYDNHNCIAFDGNQEANINCSKTITTSADVNGYITVVAEAGDSNAQASSGSFQFTLVDEETGLDINFSDYNSLKFYGPDSNTVFDFNLNNTKNYTWYDFAGRTGYLEIIYSDSVNTRINKYFNSTILATDFANTDGKIRICVAKRQQFYQQIFVSITSVPVVLYNETADCYSIASYTEYSYSNRYGLQATTINRPYKIYTITNGILAILTNLDGSLESQIDLDAIGFNTTDIEIIVGYDNLAFVPLLNTETGVYDTNILQIYFQSYHNDYVSTNLKIYENTTLLYETTQDVNANEFVLNWDWNAFNFTDENIIKIVVTGTKADGTTKTTTEYFTVYGAEYTTNKDPTFIAIMTMLFFLFGITITTVNKTFGWIGIIVCIISMAISLMALPGMFYIAMLQGGLFICFLYIILNAGTSPGTTRGMR